jgi:stress response protein YsnF
MIVPVLEEVVVVQKQLAFKKELPIWRRAEAEAVEVPVSL